MAVGWYLRFSLSYRDVEELLAERGLSVDHVTVWRWDGGGPRPPCSAALNSFQCFQPFAPRAKRMTNEPSILVSEVALGNSGWIWLPSHAPAILQLLGSRVIA
jgi:hypothetical protein